MGDKEGPGQSGHVILFIFMVKQPQECLNDRLAQACPDLLCYIDSPEFPPSEVKSEVKEAVDFSYTELENLESTHGMHLNYHNRVYVLSADIVLDSPYQSFGHIEYFISPDKDNLTDKALLSYSFDYDNKALSVKLSLSGDIR